MSTRDAPLPVAPRVDGAAPRVLVVCAPYNKDVVEGLAAGAARILTQAGAAHDRIDVAGALELPQAIRLALRARGGHYDAYVALGCVIRGDTDHYDHVCREAMRGLMDVALQYGVPVGNGLLTVHTEQQAVERAGADGFNKGAEAAVAALGLVQAARRLDAAASGNAS
ncbi:6,7-dimethyl-8-ribityllumazine synthase [Acidisphaera rubrifaciens]|uniref:6,7-dimethyl-8-ribityllumazine synthase n=1 Tax=Acidisphaera rubrifaciens HS-AP3 TaxID=1231350 RepID=A0A0D6P8N9_9PROT|nr:6,7-dimethyl-8-ribityllumazine synthase [Acidisphaera rubrifaciens]GAN78047.1 6,7-dimethyl-8-ribityllumazine synthase [Acidisphaera rubrifaciens HS-AP3]